MSNALEFLRHLQQSSTIHTLFQSFQAPLPIDHNRVASKFGLSPDAMAELRSRFGDSLQSWADSLLSGLCKDIQRGAVTAGLPLPPSMPVIGTLPTGRVNAMAIPVPNSSEHIVAFDSGLFNFVHLFCKALLLALPYEETQGAAGVTTPADISQWCNSLALDGDCEYLTRFQQVLLASIFLGDPRMCEAYMPQRHILHLAEELVRVSELFIVGHEFGHITLEHLTPGNARRAPMDRFDVEAKSYTWTQEYDADRAGFALMLAATPESDIRTCVAGATLFFSCIEVIEHARAILDPPVGEGIYVESISHPPPSLRREAILNLVRQASQDPVEGGEAVHLARLFQELAQRLMHATTPLLESLRIAPPDWRHMTRLVGLDKLPQGPFFVVTGMGLINVNYSGRSATIRMAG